MSASVVLLAAGDSSRFIDDKRFALINGVPMCAASAQIYIDCGCDVTLVVKPGESKDISALFSKNTAASLSVIENTAVATSMLDTLCTGLRSIDADHALIALADMPFVKKCSVERLISELGNADFIALEHHGRLGHPRAIARRRFNDVYSLQGDQGARELFADSNNQVLRIPSEDAAILRDVDYQSDLQSAQ